MSEKKSSKHLHFVDDERMPTNTLSVERIEEIERLMIPRLKEALEKLRQEKPELFKNSKK